jgi:hypothetical protein
MPHGPSLRELHGSEWTRAVRCRSPRDPGQEAAWTIGPSRAKERYISLTTYQGDGQAVATPVWFALEGTRILVWTSGKAKRPLLTR